MDLLAYLELRPFHKYWVARPRLMPGSERANVTATRSSRSFESGVGLIRSSEGVGFGRSGIFVLAMFSIVYAPATFDALRAYQRCTVNVPHHPPSRFRRRHLHSRAVTSRDPHG